MDDAARALVRRKAREIGVRVVVSTRARLRAVGKAVRRANEGPIQAGMSPGTAFRNRILGEVEIRGVRNSTRDGDASGAVRVAVRSADREGPASRAAGCEEPDRADGAT